MIYVHTKNHRNTRKEQAKITKELAAINNEIKQHNITFEQLSQDLTDSLELLDDCAAFYKGASDTIKRMMNQAIFEKIYASCTEQISPDIEAKFNPPYNTIIEPFQKELTQLNRSIRLGTDAALARIATAKNRILSSLRCGLCSCDEHTDIESYPDSNYFNYKSSSNAFLVEMRGTRMLRIRRPRLLFQSPSDTSQLDNPLDCLVCARALLGFNSPHLRHVKRALRALCVVGLLSFDSKKGSRIIRYRLLHYDPAQTSNPEPIEPGITDLSYADEPVVLSYKQEQHSLTDDEIRQVIELYGMGASTYALAQKFGCHRSTVSRALKQAGIEVTHTAAKREALVGKVLEMYADYQKPVDIGKALGINVTTVRKILHDNNIHIRHSSEYRSRT